MNRLVTIAATLALTGCQCIGNRDVTSFRCGTGGECSEGFTCCTDGYCRADCSTTGAGGGGGGTGGGGGGVACTAGDSCTGNTGAPCRLGRTACSGNMSVCQDGPNQVDGTVCSTGNVCISGACTACVDATPCATNPTPCLQGALECSGPTPKCADTVKVRGPGESCGTDKVCDAAGACIDCKQNGPCTGNPTACRVGATGCSTGAPVCGDGANRPGGTSCGNNQVCDGAGSCITCMDGNACSTNSDPCKNGVLTCGGAAPACNDGPAKALGATCGMDRVCNTQGQCVACAAMQQCPSNPSPCKQGVTSCATGVSTCSDSTADRTPGTTCGMNRVCNASGACIDCTAGAQCTGNPNVCKLGSTQCDTGAVVCADGTGNAPNGTMCGGTQGQTCNSGFCGMCTQGSTCTGNPTVCRVGTQDCNGAQPACLDGMANLPPGTGCGTGRVCDASGACVGCTAGQACNTNPNACKAGVTSCVSGAQTCVDGADLMLGSACLGGFCASGACVPCAIGAVCTSNPTPCKTGLFARGGMSGDQCVCNDDRDRGVGQVNPGCTGSTTCNGMGMCVPCNQGCPVADCRRGAVSCATLQCTDVGGLPDGTPCSTGSCAGGACCSGCREGSTCYPGGNVLHCGRSGSVCADCSGTSFGPCMYSDPCDTTGDRVQTVGVCTGSMTCGSNSSTVINDPTCTRGTSGAPCPGGTCNLGACCTGCIRTGTCFPGFTNAACGNGGVPCITCPSLRICEPGPPPFCDFP